VLGDTHIITVSYCDFWMLLSRNLRDDIRDQVDIQQSIRPAHLLRSVQLIIHSWFSARRLNVAPPTPAFTDILLRIQMASYQLPSLPGIYHDLTFSTKQPSGTPPTSVSSGERTGSSDLSTISGSVRSLPASAGLGNTPRPTPPVARNVFVQNDKPDAALQAMIP
jgi:hypothetical protein